MKRILSLCGCLFLLTGCSLSYEIEIDEESTVKEQIFFVEKNEVLGKYGTDISSSVQNVSTFFLTSMEVPRIFLTTERVKNFTDNNTDTTVCLTQNYTNIINLKSSALIRNFSDGLTLTNEGSTKKLYIPSLRISDIDELLNNFEYKFDLDVINLKIKLPFKVTSENADIINEKSNEYIWVITKDNYYNKSINLEYTSEVVIKKGWINNIIDSLNNKEGKNFIEKYATIIVLIVVVSATIIAIAIKKMRKNNSL